MYIQHVVKWSEMFHSTRAGIIVLNFRICFLHVAAGCIHVRIYKAHTNRNHIYIYNYIHIYSILYDHDSSHSVSPAEIFFWVPYNTILRI